MKCTQKEDILSVDFVYNLKFGPIVALSLI
jgi:hypothetical protein